MRNVIAFTLAAMFVPALVSAAPCEQMAHVAIADGTVTGARVVPPGDFTPGAGGEAGSFAKLPAFCRVEITLRPAAGSEIAVETWMPVDGWNGKFLAVGNGGWAGSISYGAMADSLARGYATSSTDTGHRGSSARFALGHAEKLIDYSHRSEHLMAVVSKVLIAAFYGSAPRWSYFNGCSTGGRQALVEAQRYPADFDGIIAGAAANPKANLDAWRVALAQAMLSDPESFIPPAEHPMLHAAVLKACDHLDGLIDGLIENPMSCRFDPKALSCGASGGENCLTPKQVVAATVIMNPVTNRTTGDLVFPRLEPGTELGWSRLLGGPTAYEAAIEQFRFIVFSDPAWDWRTFNLERDLAAATTAGGGVLAGVDPDLTAFAQRGGKLLTYHGWADPSIAPQASVNFHTRALAATKPPAASPDWLRLFMVPGMGHCRGGAGPDTFDAVGALEHWVERGQPPARIIASRSSGGKVERTRPLCPFPQVARYGGTGSIDDAANFTCKAP